MIQHDLSQWPLVISVIRGAMTREEQSAFFSAWTSWLDRGDSFATLRVFSDTASLERPDGGAKEAKAWLQTNAERIKSSVKGMATVVPAESFEDMNRINAEKLFGVPAKTFVDVLSAIAWINDSVFAARQPIDIPAAKRFLIGE
jgi:hypothetical protein